MYSPSVRERVETSSRPGVFLVLSVDEDAGTVDLVALEAHAYLLSDVPISQIRPCMVSQEGD